MLIDTHVHLNVSPLYEAVDAVIDRATKVGVDSFLVVGFDPLTITRALELADRYASVFLALGFHPTMVHELTAADYHFLKSSLRHPKVRALGEIGLDLHWNKTTLDSQISHLKTQLSLAKDTDLPVVIHMRDAPAMTLKILQEFAPLKGVMHCYSGPLEMVEDFLACGLHIGLDGPVTFKNAYTPKQVAKAVPLDRLLLETDAPYLAPHPHRGKTNEPAYLPLIMQTIATLRQIDPAALMTQTTHNARALFNIQPY